MKKALLRIFITVFILSLSSLACGLPQKQGGINRPVESSQSDATEPPAEVMPSEAAPQPAATEAAQAQERQPNAYYEGISFYYDPALAQNVSAQTMPASAPVSDDTPPFAVNPTTYQFTFQGYALNDKMHTPAIDIYNLQEYKNLDPDNVNALVDSLQKLLANRPSNSSGALPFLPIWNAAQVFHAQLKYIHFQNGEGIRYLSQGAQAATPVNNHDMFYTFQGITTDGAYYISAILPVSNAMLPADYESGMAGRDYMEFSDNYLSYISDIQNRLNEQNAAAFTPNLEQLDALFETLKVDR